MASQWVETMRARLEREHTRALSFERVFSGMVTHARVQRVVDGDTLDVCFFFHRRPVSLRVRLYGINTPELRRGDKREEARAAKRYVQELTAQHDHFVVLRLMELDAFGRALCEVFLPSPSDGAYAPEHAPEHPPAEAAHAPEGASLNHLLVQLGHAEYYMCEPGRLSAA